MAYVTSCAYRLHIQSHAPSPAVMRAPQAQPHGWRHHPHRGQGRGGATTTRRPGLLYFSRGISSWALRQSFETEGPSPMWHGTCMGSQREPNPERQRYRAADRASRKCPQGPSTPYKAMSLPRYTLDLPLLRPSGIQAILRPYTEDGSMVPVHPSRRKSGATSASGQRTSCVESALRA